MLAHILLRTNPYQGGNSLGSLRYDTLCGQVVSWGEGVGHHPDGTRMSIAPVTCIPCLLQNGYTLDEAKAYIVAHAIARVDT